MSTARNAPTTDVDVFIRVDVFIHVDGFILRTHAAS
jgi:hypothetical protein